MASLFFMLLCMFISESPFLVIIFFLVVMFFLITMLKKWRQVRKVWSGSISATLHISGKELCCQHCGHTKFWKREGILVTSGVAFFRFSFWNQSAACYTCIECGHIEWFLHPVEEKLQIIRDETVGS